MKVAVTVATYADKNEKWLENWDKFLGSAHYLESPDWCWCVNFNGPWRDNDVSAIQKGLRQLFPRGDFRTIRPGDYGHPPPMSRIREDTARLAPDATVYLLVDDDFVFRNGVSAAYARILSYMRNGKCGVVMAAGHFGGWHSGNKIVRVSNVCWWTNRGLFLRNVGKKGGAGWRFCPPPYNLVGPFEEVRACFTRFARGYYGAKLFNVPVHHRAIAIDTPEKFLKGNERKGRYDADVDMHNPKFDDVTRHVRALYDDPTWKYGHSLPRALRQMEHLK